MESAVGNMELFTFSDYITFVSGISNTAKQVLRGSPNIDDVLRSWTRTYGKTFEDFTGEVQDACHLAVFCALRWTTLIANMYPTPSNGQFDVIFPKGWISSKSSPRLESSRRPISALKCGFCQPHFLPSIETLSYRQNLSSSQQEMIYVFNVNYGMLH
jgi:hypothetical protein